MSFENLFVRSPKFIGGIQLDGVITESHNNSVRVTKNPVELGAEITDNAIIEPKIITILAEVTDTPLGSAAFAQIVDSVTGLFGTSTSNNITRSSAAYNALVQLQEERERIEVQTKLKLYSNMLITNISTTQDKNTSRIVRMSITLEEILITESEIITLESEQLLEGSVREQGTSPENRGRQETVVPDDTTNKSVLKSVIDWVGG